MNATAAALADPPELTIVIPSRGRPEKCADAVQSVADTATTRPVVVVATDHDDPELPGYVRHVANMGLPETLRHVMVMTSSPAMSGAYGAGHVGAVNLGASAVWGNGSYAAMKIDDDHRPRTAGFDRLLVDALEDLDGGIVYANDLFQGANLPTAFAMSSDLVIALGWMMPPAMRHLYSDNAVKDIGERLGRLRYLPDVVVEHMHPHAGKASHDEHYARVNSPQRWEYDGAAYRAWKRHPDGLAADVARVRARLGW